MGNIAYLITDAYLKKKKNVLFYIKSWFNGLYFNKYIPHIL